MCGVVVAVVLAPAGGSAQQNSAPLTIGSHVRVRGPGAHSAIFSGRLRLMSNDSITVELDDDSTSAVPFAVPDIGRLEVERDEKTREQATTVMGAIGAAGGLTAAVFWCMHNQADCAEDAEQMVNAAANDSSYVGPSLLMIMGGTLVGSLLGYVLAPPPHWEVVAFPTRTSTLDGSPRYLLNVGLRYSFGGRRHR